MASNPSLSAIKSNIAAAVEELQEDPEDSFSMAKLAELQGAIGNAKDATITTARLKADYGTTLEDWLAVRGFRQ